VGVRMGSTRSFGPPANEASTGAPGAATGRRDRESASRLNRLRPPAETTVEEGPAHGGEFPNRGNRLRPTVKTEHEVRRKAHRARRDAEKPSLRNRLAGVVATASEGASADARAAQKIVWRWLAGLAALAPPC